METQGLSIVMQGLDPLCVHKLPCLTQIRCSRQLLAHCQHISVLGKACLFLDGRLKRVLTVSCVLTSLSLFPNTEEERCDDMAHFEAAGMGGYGLSSCSPTILQMMFCLIKKLHICTDLSNEK